MTLVDRRLISHFDWTLMGLALILFALGVVNLYSASGFRMEDGITLTSSFYRKQLYWGMIGLGGMIFFLLVDYRHLHTLAWPLFILTILTLLATLFWGKTIMGAKRWLDLGLFNFQSSEFAKISLLVICAKLLSQDQGKLGWNQLLMFAAIGLVPALLIVKQPDLGSAITLLLILGGMILFRGVRGPVLKVLALITPAVLPLGWYFLHDYQRLRILGFLDPSNDPLGSGYHIIQSQIAVGSGQLWGRGFLEGTQSQLRFLPEKHTDFALAVLGEEWGFIGCFILLLLLSLFLLNIVRTAAEAKDYFGCYLAVGIFFYFFWQITINMGMVLGLMPVVGIPLPLISYGGTSTLTSFCLIGLALNVSMRRFFFKKN
ncbi:cell elongation-specific peptidoglycan biosynthesis regulator RodA [Desulfonatronum thiosulfatophilum]|uniref:Peptidoglycan glycosyltransferase RodA n=1 Tax=Desulfonatronum thiosulfatophilum TaxID=617002 RepID=A0A1G6C2W9_9BACT|nr:rod shape-determining protein RodA [Desulfonatronum thiosulfatophilum]SDB27242.1 cell elongation-specific peptidoglycan biosynthesis regulator RodA [Desulfonatronum thiosulfatophilum]